MIGTVYSGINNIFDVRCEGTDRFECRIKGKILKEEEQDYNPLAPGDQVELEPTDSGKGLILSRLPRKNRFARWNKKRDAWQIAAANLDAALAVVSCGRPPFRPRFVDRVLIAAVQGKVPSAVLVNKIDQGLKPWMEERIAVWEDLGIRVLKTSAIENEGLDELREFCGTGTVALFGPSGVGKSSLLNELLPGVELATGHISDKYDRGRHVTNFGRLLDAPWGGRMVDTPGVREVLVHGISPAELPLWFPEFEAHSHSCRFTPCSHRHEPECGIQTAVEEGFIHPDRYENYLRIRDELEDDKNW